MLKYELISDDIRMQIVNRTFKPGDRLPTTDELCDQYEVSKITIKRAMDELELQGYISRRRGSGTYVKGLVEEALKATGTWSMSSQMTGFRTEHAGEKIDTAVHDFSVQRPNKHIRELLDMDKDEFAYHVCRTRIANDVPLTVEYTYMPIKVIPDLREKNVEGSIYTYIEKDLGLKIANAHRVVRAVNPTTDECEWLKVQPSDPLLEVEQIGFLDNGVPFEYSISHHIKTYEFYSISTH